MISATATASGTSGNGGLVVAISHQSNPFLRKAFRHGGGLGGYFPTFFREKRKEIGEEERKTLAKVATIATSARQTLAVTGFRLVANSHHHPTIATTFRATPHQGGGIHAHN